MVEDAGDVYEVEEDERVEPQGNSPQGGGEGEEGAEVEVDLGVGVEVSLRQAGLADLGKGRWGNNGGTIDKLKIDI